MAHSNLILFSCMSTMSSIVWIIKYLVFCPLAEVSLSFPMLSLMQSKFPCASLRFPYFPLKVPVFPSKGSRIGYGPVSEFPAWRWWQWPAQPAQHSPAQPPLDWFYIQPSPAHPGWSPINDINIHHLSRYSANTWPRSLAGHVATWDVVYQIAGRVCALYPPTINHPH